jgi:rubrerythrin
MPLLYISELIDIAVKDEQSGLEVYRAMAEVARDPRLRERFLAIALMEEAQLVWFRKMRAEIGEAKVAETYSGEDEEYLRALTAPAFPEPGDAAAFARKAASDIEAVDLAMRMEKESLLLLDNMRRHLGRKHHPYVNVVIDEEKQHLVELAGIHRTLVRAKETP